MALRRPRRAALACALTALLTVLLAGCSSGRFANAGREGRPEDIDHLAYNVYLTRELNPRDPEDAGYYQGSPPPPGYGIYGVFVAVCNESRGGPPYPAAPAGNYKIIDTNGDTFYPQPLPTTNVFAYRPTLVAHRSCIPTPGSIPAQSPTAGALLLFQLPFAALENRPVDLIIHGPRDPVTGRSTGVRRIELDV